MKTRLCQPYAGALNSLLVMLLLALLTLPVQATENVPTIMDSIPVISDLQPVLDTDLTDPSGDADSLPQPTDSSSDQAGAVTVLDGTDSALSEAQLGNSGVGNTSGDLQCGLMIFSAGGLFGALVGAVLLWWLHRQVKRDREK